MATMTEVVPAAGSGYSDPVKLLAMFAAEGAQGIEEVRIPYYALLLREDGVLPFSYAFDWVPGLHSDTLSMDVERMILAGFLSAGNSPVAIAQGGEELLRGLGDEMHSLIAKARGAIARYEDQNIVDLLHIAYRKLTHRAQ